MIVSYTVPEIKSISINCQSIFYAETGKFVSPEMIARRVAKCGDGSHYLDCKEVHKDAVWGLGDKDIPLEDLEELNSMKY